MKISKLTVKLFEEEQKLFGTKTALSNIVFTLAHNLLKDLGVTRLKVTYARPRTSRSRTRVS